MVMAVSGLEWSERLTERLQRLQSHGPVSSERGNLGQGRGTERRGAPRTLYRMHNVEASSNIRSDSLICNANEILLAGSYKRHCKYPVL